MRSLLAIAPVQNHSHIMKHTRNAITASIGLGFLLCHVAAHSQDSTESIYAPCGIITDNAERLACFDRTLAQETAIREQRNAMKREVEIESFGLTPKQLREREQANIASAARSDSSSIDINEAPDQTDTSSALFQEDKKTENNISAVVSEVLTDALGNYVLILDNGQIWRSTSNKSFRGRVRNGWQVEISKIWSGGYRLTIADKTGFLGVSRVR